MKVYEIDTGCLKAEKGTTIIKMITVEDIIISMRNIWKDNRMRGSCEFRKGLLTMRSSLLKEFK